MVVFQAPALSSPNFWSLGWNHGSGASTTATLLSAGYQGSVQDGDLVQDGVACPVVEEFRRSGFN